MSWDDLQRQEQFQRREDDRRRREQALMDQQRRQHEGVMKQQRDHFAELRREDRAGRAQDPPQPQTRTPRSVWYFGGIGVLFGSLNPPFHWDGFMGGVLGFLVGGFLGGFLRQFAWGRALLWIVGLGFAGLMAFAIYRA